MKKNRFKKKSSLRELLSEDVATTVAVAGPQEPAPSNDISLDQKIDHFLIQYERESVPVSQQFPQESRKPSLKSLMNYLFEAPEDEEPVEDDVEPGEPGLGGDTELGGDLDMGDNTGGGLDLGGLGGGGGGSGGLGGFGEDDAAGGGPGGGSSGNQAPPVNSPKINISNFARNIARLANEYQSLLDPKRIILNRARAYVEKNYNPAVASQLMDILETEFNLSPESLADRENEIEMPIAAGALEPIG